MKSGFMYAPMCLQFYNVNVFRNILQFRNSKNRKSMNEQLCPRFDQRIFTFKVWFSQQQTAPIQDYTIKRPEVTGHVQENFLVTFCLFPLLMNGVGEGNMPTN